MSKRTMSKQAWMAYGRHQRRPMSQMVWMCFGRQQWRFLKFWHDWKQQNP